MCVARVRACVHTQGHVFADVVESQRMDMALVLRNSRALIRHYIVKAEHAARA
jgi:hypothetical protein